MELGKGRAGNRKHCEPGDKLGFFPGHITEIYLQLTLVKKNLRALRAKFHD